MTTKNSVMQQNSANHIEAWKWLTIEKGKDYMLQIESKYQADWLLNFKKFNDYYFFKWFSWSACIQSWETTDMDKRQLVSAFMKKQEEWINSQLM